MNICIGAIQYICCPLAPRWVYLFWISLSTSCARLWESLLNMEKSGQNPGSLKNQNNLLGVETSGEISQRWWKDADDRVWVHEDLFKSKCQNPRQNWLLGCYSEQLLKNLKLQMDTIGYRLPFLTIPRGQVDKPVWSPFPNYTNAVGGGGGDANKRGWGGSQVQRVSRILAVAVFKLGFS
jgi:hypothetical protein